MTKHTPQDIRNMVAEVEFWRNRGTNDRQLLRLTTALKMAVDAIPERLQHGQVMMRVNPGHRPFFDELKQAGELAAKQLEAWVDDPDFRLVAARAIFDAEGYDDGSVVFEAEPERPGKWVYSPGGNPRAVSEAEQTELQGACPGERAGRDVSSED